MLTKAQIVKKIRATLESGPVRAKEIVGACVRRGAKSSRVFYWLKKLEGTGEIRKVDGKYELIKFEEASEDYVNFLIAKMKSKKLEVREAAIQDFMDLCRRKRVSQYDAVWSFVREWLREGEEEEEDKKIEKGKKGKRIRKEEKSKKIEGERKDRNIHALRFLERIAFNPLTPREKETINRLFGFRKNFEDAVVDESLDHFYRSNAVLILEMILTEEEFSDFSLNAPEGDMPVFERLLREASREKGSIQIDRTMWKILLDIHSKKNELIKLREWLYPLLEDKNKNVRRTAFRLLDELRGKERGIDLSIKF